MGETPAVPDTTKTSENRYFQVYAQYENYPDKALENY